MWMSVQRERSGQSERQHELADAEIVESYPNSYLVEKADGTIEPEPKTSINTILLEDGVDLETSLESVMIRIQGSVDESEIDDDWGTDVFLSVDILDRMARIQVGNNRLRVPDTRMMPIYESVTSEIEDADVTLTEETIIEGTDAMIAQTRRLFRDIMQSRARRVVVEDFVDEFGDAVESVDAGWILGDEFLLTEEADVVKPTAPEIELLGFSNTPTDAVAIDGVGMMTKTEQEFLATALAITHAEEYCGVELIDADIEVDLPDEIVGATEDLDVSKFRDNVSGRLHSHSLDKHVLSQSVGLTDDVKDELVFNLYDHAGPNELAMRQEEFESRGIDVFDDDKPTETCWDRVNACANGARITEETASDIQALGE